MICARRNTVLWKTRMLANANISRVSTCLGQTALAYIVGQKCSLHWGSIPRVKRRSEPCKNYLTYFDQIEEFAWVSFDVFAGIFGVPQNRECWDSASVICEGTFDRKICLFKMGYFAKFGRSRSNLQGVHRGVPKIGSHRAPTFEMGNVAVP